MTVQDLADRHYAKHVPASSPRRLMPDPDWYVYRRARRGGDRAVCRCWSEKIAQEIVTALNTTEAMSARLRRVEERAVG